MREEISKILGVEKTIVDLFFENHLIDAQSVNKFLVKHEFKQMRQERNDKNADLYFELSEKYRVSENTIYKWINDYVQTK